MRGLIDEDNQLAVTDQNIIDSLNRAQKFASNILARHYPEPLLKYVSLDIEAGVSEYNIPEDIFEDRVEKLEMATFQGNFAEVLRIDYRDLSAYESDLRTNVPAAYALYSKKLRVVPTPSGTYDARLWYLCRPGRLVKSQGRITKINTTGNYLIVDEIGPDLTTEQDQLASYVNIVSGTDGRIKYSAQIKSISGNKILFKTTPARTTVAGHVIQTDMTDLADENVIEPDDYVCVITGTCIPFFQDPITNFMIEYANAEMTRKLGGPAENVQRTLQAFEEQVERTWVGREQTRRVKKRNKHFHSRTRRWLYPTGVNNT